MKQIFLSICLLFPAFMSLRAGTGGTHCQYSPFFQDNVTIKADIPGSQLHIDKEATFRVYLKTTMNVPFYDAKLDVLSDQFDATVAPSPTWKSYPDVTPVKSGGAKEYFTVTLKRKSDVPDGKYDVAFKLYSSRRTFRRLSFFLPLSETLDEHTVPLAPNFQIDGKPRPEQWAAGALANNFWAFKQEPKKAGLSSYSPSAQTRIHVVGSADSIYLLAYLFGCGLSDTLQIRVAPEIESAPVALTLNTATSKIDSSKPLEGVQCLKCDTESGPGVAVYEIKIPRKSLGIASKNYFFLDFSRSTTGLFPEKVDLTENGIETSYWRGNALSIDDPVVYGKMEIGEAGASTVQAVR